MKKEYHLSKLVFVSRLPSVLIKTIVHSFFICSVILSGLYVLPNFYLFYFTLVHYFQILAQNFARDKLW
jgi:hypothetical protein